MTTTTRVENLDRTIHKTNEWLEQLRRKLSLDEPRQAYQALRAALHAIRDRLPVDEAAHLGAQLPLLVRGVYYDGWRPAHKPLVVRDLQEFLGRVKAELPPVSRLEPRRVVSAVIELLSEHVTAGEMDDVKSAMPAALRELWP